MKEYELVVLMHPDLEPTIDEATKKVRELIVANGGEIVSEENWGKKRLTYNIKKQDFAVYVLFNVMLPSDAPLKISNNLNISDEVIRYLLSLVDLKGRKALAEAKQSAETTEKSEDVSDKE